MNDQVPLAELPQARRPQPSAPTRPESARVVRAVRGQIEWGPIDLESRVPADHAARAIWAFLERLDLSAFYRDIKAVLEHPGRPGTDPQVLLALWLLATSEGIGSARRLARLCDEHDAYRWLRGGVPINYHMLADFRVANERALNELLTNMLAVMMAEGLVSLQRVAQDGVRVRASAGADSFHGQASLEECFRRAREQVDDVAREREHPPAWRSRRQQAAQERAARERAERVERALARLPEVEAAKWRQRRTLATPVRARVTEARVSTTDAEARVMRMADGGFRPAYNAQVATDVASQVIVGVAVTNRGTDQGEALPMERQVVQRMGRHPDDYLIDGGYVKRDDITALETNGVAVFAPLRPPRTLTSQREATDPRPDDSAHVVAWRARMGTDEAKAVYKHRAATAECVNAQFRHRFGIQQFPVRGLAKTLSIVLLVAVTHNLLRWIALNA